MYSCASQSPLQGGIKDEKPPILISCEPKNKSLNFNEKKISLNFNEFLQLKSIQQKFVISPPVAEKPNIMIKGKSVIISFKDSLSPNTTYNLNFSDAIADLNEGNSINDFHYCFSTGSYIDSLKISGIILNALTQKPEKGMLVMLYNDTLDSVPIKNIPFYIGKTNENGNFNIENIRSGRYKIFSLQDGNSNMLFDLPTETIAYSDIIIVPFVKIEPIIPDSTKNDTNVVASEKIIYKPDSIILYAFEEDRTKQFVKKVSRPFKNKCIVQFNRKGFGDFFIIEKNTNNFLIEKNKSLDSLTIWIKDSIDYLKDTLRFKISYYKKDSLNKLNKVEESCVFPNNNSGKNISQINKLVATTNFNNKQLLNSNTDIKIRFSNPVTNLTAADIIIEESKDSLYHIIKPNLIADSLSPCVYHVSYNWKNEMNYRIKIEKNKLHDIYNLICDSLVKYFKTQSLDYYSSASFSINGINNNYVYQLVDLKGNVITEWNGNTPNQKKIEFLNPGKYRLKAFVDKNNNNIWDTGFYIEHKQPEKIYYYPEEINLRSNWEIEVKWEIKE